MTNFCCLISNVICKIDYRVNEFNASSSSQTPCCKERERRWQALASESSWAEELLRMLGRGAGRRSCCWEEELGRGPDGELAEVDGGGDSFVLRFGDSFDWLRAPRGLSVARAAASWRNRGREKCCAGEKSATREKMHRREGVSILLGGRAPMQFASSIYMSGWRIMHAATVTLEYAFYICMPI
jgi:hypothetical protein